MKYRAEIDGLRAFAVVPVILFHGGVSIFSGGFVGVDVFFVISGYLITTILVNELDEDRFSLLTFYERRARRILPALFVVVVCSIPMAWAVMLPGDLRDFFQSLIGVVTFSSNILFWRESGYFDTAAELKPMLHTWSLAVEEQFYIFFPLLLMAFWRVGRHRLLWLLGGLFVLSLAGAQWGAYNAPSGTFYLLPTRGWELLIGAFVAFYLQKRPPPDGTVITNGLSAVGLGLILVSIFLFDETTPFPSLYALAPTVGTALVILYARPGTLAHMILAQPVCVGIGLISYSAYLWHQPLLAFLHQPLTPQFTPFDTAIAIALTFVLAYATWALVERPTRNRRLVPMRGLVVLLAVPWAVISAAAIFVQFNAETVRDRWMASQPEEFRNMITILTVKGPKIDNWGMNAKGEQVFSDCRFNMGWTQAPNKASALQDCNKQYGPGVLLVGDSHAGDIYGTIASRFDAPFLIGLTRGGCRAHVTDKACRYDWLLNFIADSPNIFEHVIYTQAGFHLLKDMDGSPGHRNMFSDFTLDASVPAFPIYEDRIESVANYLRELSEYVPVTWFGPRIEPHFKRRAILENGCNHPFALRDGQQDVFDRLDQVIAAEIAADKALSFVSQNETFNFRFPDDFMTCREIYWTDGDHLSAKGEALFGERLPDGFLKRR